MPKAKKTGLTQAQIYDRINTEILTHLENGVAPWEQPWSRLDIGKGGPMPHNYATGRRYSGVNVPMLWSAAMAGGYSSNGWLTFKQAKTLGGTVRRGEKGTFVVFAKRVLVKDKDKPEEDARPIYLLKGYTVFNTEQCSDLKERSFEPVTPATPNPDGRILQLEETIENTGANIQHGGDRAFYAPGPDMIQMPTFGQFKSAEFYYHTMLHELGHWTGHSSRLNREGWAPFGTERYAREELVAELCASYALAAHGVDADLNQSAAYLKSWIKAIKDDEKFFVQACSRASAAADMLLGFAEELDADEPMAAAA